MAYDELTNEPRVQHDTDNETTFHAQDVPNVKRLDGSETLREKYSRLFLYNSGHYNGKWGDQEKIRRQDNLHMFDSIASRLDLVDHQRKRGRQLLDSISVKDIGRPTELICFCLCAHVYNEDAADEHRYHPNRKVNPDRFEILVEDIGFNSKSINSVYNKLGCRLDV